MEGVTMPLQKSPQASDQISLDLRSVFEGGGVLKSQDGTEPWVHHRYRLGLTLAMD
jgi:hypothetical protein